MTRRSSDKDHPSKHRTKPKAAALKYDGSNTPKIIAKGEGDVAQEIIDIAQKNHVHIHYDPLLLEVLSRLELNEEIPETLYLAVAKIIAFAYYLQGKCPAGYEPIVQEEQLIKLSGSPDSQVSNEFEKKPPLELDTSSLATTINKDPKQKQRPFYQQQTRGKNLKREP